MGRLRVGLEGVLLMLACSVRREAVAFGSSGQWGAGSSPASGSSQCSTTCAARQ